MTSDAELLRRYLAERAEPAFAELVRRHLNLVYSAALRQVGGDAHRAEEVAQAVFNDLARKAASLTGRPSVAGWLHTSTRFAAAKVVRAEVRRREIEAEAQLMPERFHALTPAADWERLRPLIDEAVQDLREPEREAVLLRFFAGCSFAEIGVTLALSEDAARMRVDRALEKLRALLSRRGVTSTSGALAAALANQVVTAAPAGLAAAISSGAIMAAPAFVGTATGIASLLTMSASSGTKLAATVAVLATLGVGVFEIRHTRAAGRAVIASQAESRAEQARFADLSQRAGAVEREVAELQRMIAEARTAGAPAAVQPSGRGGGGGGGVSDELATPEALAAGREFLAKHPEMERALIGIRRDHFEATWSQRLVPYQLSPAEYEQVFAEWVRQYPWSFRMKPPRWSVSSDGPFVGSSLLEYIRALVGDTRFQGEDPGESTPQRAGRPRNLWAPDVWVRPLARALHDTEAPLTPGQAEAVVRTLDQIRSGDRPATWSPDSPRWTDAELALAQVLSASQMETLRNLRESGTVSPRL